MNVTLYEAQYKNRYTSDISSPISDFDKDIYYADEINQLITGETKKVRYMALYTGSRRNGFEKKWQIKNNTAKTKIIHISRRRAAAVVTEDQEYY